MAVEIKFCGLTRPEDTAEAVSLGAAYVGVVFAESPRRIEPSDAGRVLAPARRRARCVGVFGPGEADRIARIARDAALDTVQLHGDPAAPFIAAVRARFGGAIWAVLRVSGASLPAGADALLDGGADAIVLDTKVAGRLGGSGESFDWTGVAPALAPARGRTRIVLAGGLTADNVGRAVRTLAPDIVDVSSGVESSPGIKDHMRMRAFRDAAHAEEMAE